MFFDKDSIFVECASTGGWVERLNARYESIILSNLDIVEGARILDIGCHDGRWMHAALAHGAELVTGVDGRRENVMRSCANLAALGYPKSRYRVFQEDVGEGEGWVPGDCDTALVLGVLYHLLSPFSLVARLARAGIRNLIVDTAICADERPVLRMYQEPGGLLGNGLPEAGAKRALVAHPSKAALEQVFETFGYELRYLPCGRGGGEGSSNSAIPSAADPMRDYDGGSRIIFRAHRVT